MMARFLAFLILLSLAAAQSSIPAQKLGLQDFWREDALIFENSYAHLAYVPGVGWAIPLNPELPGPEFDSEGFWRIPLAVVRAANLILAPEASLRLNGEPGRFRLVFDLPESWIGPKAELAPYPGSVELNLPFFLPDIGDLELPAGVSLEAEYSQYATRLVVNMPPGLYYRYRAVPLAEPDRYVLDLYYLSPEKTEALAKGIAYREVWGWNGLSPLRLSILEAAAKSWRMEPIGRPGEKTPLTRIAPDALAILNGGYFDPRTGTPIGLWIKNGVMINLPYGRSTLLWEQHNVFATVPKFDTWVQTPAGSKLRVGVNLNRARYTVHTVDGTVGEWGQNVAIVEGDKVVASLPAPVEIKEGQWALAYPADIEPPARTGETLKFYGNLEPPVDHAMEGGPLLIQSGEYVFDPKNEPFRDKSPLVAVANQSAVAWTKDGGIWLVICEPTTPGVLGKLLLERGAWGALRMDGGSSSQLWVNGSLRAPAGNHVRQVVNGLALYAAEK